MDNLHNENSNECKKLAMILNNKIKSSVNFALNDDYEYLQWY